MRVQSLKKELVKYLGTRLVDSDVEETMPGVLVKTYLNKEDKKEMAKLCSDDDYLIFIAGDDDAIDHSDQDYLNCKIEYED